MDLTPDKPKSGSSWYSVQKGYHFPGGSTGVPAIHSTIFGNDINSFLVITLHTVTDAYYMLDIEVGEYGSSKLWELTGNIVANMQSQDGHIIGGFIASDTESEIKLLKSETGWGYIYGIHLTRVDQ